MGDCAICRRALRQEDAHRTACIRCSHRMRGMLHEIGEQLPFLHASLRLDGAPAQGRSPGRAHAPLPVREDVLSLLGPAAPGPVRDALGDQRGSTPVLAVIHAWAEQLAADLGHKLGPYKIGDNHLGYLNTHLPFICVCSWAGELYAELAELIQVVRAITRTEPRKRAKDAPCPQCGSFALIEEDWQTYIECGTCAWLMTAEEYAAHHTQVMPPLYRLGVLLVAHQNTPTTTEPQ